MSDSTPTERFSVQPDAGDGPKSKRLLYVLIGIGAVLLIAVIILLVVLLTRPTGSNTVAETPIPSATASETPSAVPSESATPVSTPSATETVAAPTPTPAPQPPAQVPGFDSFHAPSHAGCQAGDTQKQLTFSWSSDDAVKAYIGVQTKNAKTAPYEADLPPVYTYTNLYYNCDQASQYYTVTLEDGAGHITNKTVTIKK